MMQFLWGALSFASFMAGLFFLRFWYASRDRLFLLFALAFEVFAVHWIVLAAGDPASEARHYVFLLRLAAFLLIVIAVVDKNRRQRLAEPSGGR